MAIETRAETSITKRLLRRTKMRIIKYIIGNALRDRFRNEEIFATSARFEMSQDEAESGNKHGEIV